MNSDGILLYLMKAGECCRFPEHRLKIQADTHVWPSTKQEKTPSSMMLEYYVSKSSDVVIPIQSVGFRRSHVK